MIKIIKKHSARNLLRLSCAALAVMLAAAVVPYLRGFAAEDAEETEVSGGDIVSGSDSGVAEQFAEPKQTLSSVVYSGACGDNATWTLDDEGTLTIDGSGPMTDYANKGPWFSSRDSIKEIVIGDGITHIGNSAFFYLEAVRSITIGSSVETIGDYSFLNCSGVSSLVIPDNVKRIGIQSFGRCYALRSVIIGSGVNYIGPYNFKESGDLTTITFLCHSFTSDDYGNWSSNTYYFSFLTDRTTVYLPEGFTVQGDEITPDNYNKTYYFGNAKIIMHPVTGVSLGITSLALIPDEAATLAAIIAPDNATDKSVTWTSSNENVATVDENGQVTAVGPGTATITVTTADGGYTATCEVTVKPGIKVKSSDGEKHIKAKDDDLSISFEYEGYSHGDIWEDFNRDGNECAVTVGGEALVKDTDFTAKSGSVMITMTKKYLDSLDPGDYSLTVLFKVNGVKLEGTASFTVAASGNDVNSPGTGESATASTLAAALMMLAGYGCVYAVSRRRRIACTEEYLIVNGEITPMEKNSMQKKSVKDIPFIAKKGVLAVLGIVMAALCFALLSFMGRHYTLKVPVPVSVTDISQLDILLESSARSSDVSPGDIIHIESGTVEDGMLTLVLHSGERGKVFLDIRRDDEWIYGDVFYVHTGGIITINVLFGYSTGCVVIPLFIVLYLAAVIAYFVQKLREELKLSLYLSSNVTYFSAIVFLMCALLRQLTGIFSYAGFQSTLSGFLGSADFFALLALPLILVVSVYVTASNIQLMRREGRNWRNMLGCILGIAVILFTLFPPILGEILQRNIEWIDVHNMKSPALYIEMIVENVVSFTAAYLECLLIGTIFFAVKAARHIPAFDKDYILILGCMIRKDGALTKLLQSRADRAVEFARMQEKATGKEIIFVPSGGQGDDEIMPEAQAIRNYLLSIGIPDERILPEDRSVNTYENLRNSAELIRRHSGRPDPKIAFSTTNYHVFRSGQLAARQGIDAEGIGSPTKKYYWINAFVREFVAMIVSGRRQHLAAVGVLTAIILAMVLATYYLNVL